MPVSVRNRPAIGSARNRRLIERSHELIPGGAHTYAKGDDQWPAGTPIIARGKGARVWDVEGNEFIEYAPGSRAVTLGHAFPPVVEAAAQQMQKGWNYTRAGLVELEAAEELTGLIKAADMVKFTKDGSTATTAAVRLARAYTGRDKVALCGDHPFFSYDDWFIGTTAMDGGIPETGRSLSLTFAYNDIAGVEALFEEHPGQIACVILEPEKNDPPRDGYLHALRELCTREGALLVFDEMITGFRYHLGGAQELHGVEPDLSTFGKALANGFSVSALAGTREVMERGGIRHPHERVFLLSTTHGAEGHALAAAIATMRTYREERVVEALAEKGEQLRAALRPVIDSSGVGDHFDVVGHPANLVFLTKGPDGRPSQPYRTLFMQEMVARGILAGSFVITYAHGDREIEETAEAVAESLELYAKALEDGYERYLRGPSVAPVYRARN